MILHILDISYLQRFGAWCLCVELHHIIILEATLLNVWKETEAWSMDSSTLKMVLTIQISYATSRDGPIGPNHERTCKVPVYLQAKHSTRDELQESNVGDLKSLEKHTSELLSRWVAREIHRVTSSSAKKLACLVKCFPKTSLDAIYFLFSLAQLVPPSAILNFLKPGICISSTKALEF